MKRTWTRSVGLAALVFAAVGAFALLRELHGVRATRARRAARQEEPLFSRLAASQVGYGPAMRKEFTSPRPFSAFRVVRDADGATALEGGAPVRWLATGLAAPLGRVWIGDFSALAAPGRYRIVADCGLESFPFDVGPDVFDGPLRAVQRAFYFQRAFTAIDAAHAEGPWVHADDSSRAPPGVRRGWHDAGDFSVYSASLNTALFWLLETYRDFAPTDDDTNIPESGNGIPDLLDEARWGLEWLLSVQEASGGFRNSTCQTGYGPYGTNFPETVPPYRDGEIGTLATARAVGTLADAASLFLPVDPAFAARCLEAARRGYGYLEDHRGEDTDGPTCPSYRADGDALVGRHVRMYAAAGMLLATGEARFAADYEANRVPLEREPSFMKMGGFGARLYLRARGGDPDRKAEIREQLALHAMASRAEGEGHPFRLAARNHWGSTGAAFTRAGWSSAARCLEAPGLAAPDCDQVLAVVHHLFGRNLLQFCYVSGLRGVTRGRRWGFHHWLAALRADPHDLPGMVAGGPNAVPEPADGSNPRARPLPIWGYFGDPAFSRGADTPIEARYTDNDSWSTNEVSLDWQASTLYGLHLARWAARGGR